MSQSGPLEILSGTLVVNWIFYQVLIFNSLTFVGGLVEFMDLQTDVPF